MLELIVISALGLAVAVWLLGRRHGGNTGQGYAAGNYDSGSCAYVDNADTGDSRDCGDAGGDNDGGGDGGCDSGGGDGGGD